MDTADRIIDDILAVMSGDAAQRANDPLPTSAGPMTPEQIIGELNYASYRANREKCSAAQLEKWFFPADGAAFEQRYQDEINAWADRAIRADKEARHTGGAGGGGDMGPGGTQLQPGS